MSAKNLITMKNVSYFNSERKINWNLKEKEIHVIVGPSGVGKSSFINILLNLMPFEGEIFDENNEKWNYENHNLAVQLQNSALLTDLTLGENIYLPLIMKYEISKEEASMIALHYMKKVNLTKDDFYKYPYESSGGMQKRAALARALILNPKILFLDEPTSGLDPKIAKQYDELLLNFDMTILMVTHDLERMRNLATKITVILKNEVITDTLSNLMKSDNLNVKEFINKND